MMKNYLYISFFFFHISFTSNAQQTNNIDTHIKYIQDYYSTYETGYDFDGKYVVISKDYKASISDAIFTLTFDTFDVNKEIKKQTVSINLKDVLSIEPYGTDVVEIVDNDPYLVPICGKLAFITADAVYEINIYYEVDADEEESQIFKAFETLKKKYN